MANLNEDELLVELDKLEKSTIAKGGDALQGAPHDGGLATEGTNIQAKAKMKKAITMMVKGGMSKSEAKKIAMKAFAKEDDSSSDVEKGMGGDDDSMSDDDQSGGGDDPSGEADDDSDSDDESEAGPPMGKPPMKKSTGAASLANATNPKGDTIRKALTDVNPEAEGAFDAVPILGQLIDQIDALARSQRGVSKKDVRAIRKSIVQVETTQSSFNGKLAKALSMIAARVIETESIVKKMASEPVIGQRAHTLRKSDITEPGFHSGGQGAIGGNGGIGEPSPLANVEYFKIQEALTDLAMKSQADLMDVTKFENSHGNLDMLPPAVLKQLEQRLCPAA